MIRTLKAVEDGENDESPPISAIRCTARMMYDCKHVHPVDATSNRS